jgi:Transposase C of IS166 homeodomain
VLESAISEAQARIEELQCSLRERDQQLLSNQAQLEARAQRIRLLEEALRVLKADKYGASREKLGGPPGQRSLFNEVETILELTQAVDIESELTRLGCAKAASQTPQRAARPLRRICRGSKCDMRFLGRAHLRLWNRAHRVWC